MRLIDADAWKKDIEENYVFTWGSYMKDDVIQSIDAQPTIEAVPVVHGRWVYYHTGIDGESEYICSNCLVTVGYEFQYCPHCGAKMDEVTE